MTRLPIAPRVSAPKTPREKTTRIVPTRTSNGEPVAHRDVGEEFVHLDDVVHDDVQRCGGFHKRRLSSVVLGRAGLGQSNCTNRPRTVESYKPPSCVSSCVTEDATLSEFGVDSDECDDSSSNDSESDTRDIDESASVMTDPLPQHRQTTGRRRRCRRTPGDHTSVGVVTPKARESGGTATGSSVPIAGGSLRSEDYKER